MEDEIIFENEVLPELEIEELLTAEQMLAFQPRFVAFSDAEISSYLYQLLHSFSRADMFSKLHKSVLVQEERSLLEQVDIFTNISRINFQQWRGHDVELEDGTVEVEWEENNFFEEIENAKNANTYMLQQYAVDRVFFPFVVDPLRGKPIIEENASIRFGSAYSRIFKHDPMQIEMDGAIWKVPSRTRKDYVMDRPFSRTFFRSRKVEWREGETHDVNAWIRRHVRPSIHDIIEKYTLWTDYHELERLLMVADYTVDDLTESEFRDVCAHLETLSESLEEADTQSMSRRLIQSLRYKMPKNGISMTDMITNEFERSTSLLTEEGIHKKQEQYSLLIQSIPPLPLQIGIPSPIEIASQLRSGSVTLEDIATTLKQWYQRWNLDTMITFMEKYMENTLDTERMNQLQLYLMDSVRSVNVINDYRFFDHYADMAEVKEGNDTRLYDGTPMAQNDYGYEDTQDADVFPNTNEGGMDGEFTADATHLIEPMMPSMNIELDDGQKEVFEIAWKRVHDIHVASGLPVDMEICIEWAKHYIIRVSRVQQLCSKIPALVEVIAKRVVVNDLDRAYQRIQDLHDAELRDALGREYRLVHEEWMNSCEMAFRLILTRWWYDLCSKSLHGSLQFTPLQGMYTHHISVWSYFGPPMQPDATSGIIFYITNVAESVDTRMHARELRKDIQNLADRYLSEETTILLQKWEEVKDTERAWKKADKAVMLLEDTIKAIKAKQRVDVLAGYLPALMYLPFMLPGKRDARKAAGWIQGCCAAVLDEKFKADIDWKSKLTDLYKIKNYLAKERWTLQQRVPLENFKETVSKEKEKEGKKEDISFLEQNKGVIEEVGADMYTVDVAKFTWIPRSHMTMLSGSTQEVQNWTRSLLEQMYPRQKALQVYQVFDAIVDPVSILSLINQFSARWENREIYDLDMFHEIKKTLRVLPVGRASKHMLMYCLVLAIGMPAFVDQGRFTAPNGMTMQALQRVWNANLQICIEWNKNGFMMTKSEIQSFITQVREKQKEISLERLDVLTDEDRQLLLEAKNIGLIRIVELEEIRIERDGAAEFAPGPSDRDDMNLDALE